MKRPALANATPGYGTGAWARSGSAGMMHGGKGSPLPGHESCIIPANALAGG
ncbi:hypothetical protein [Haloferula sp. BvORR071]|uniref:hypothetical protein n=1 Tax=Haloferula sp. BvORR071 TaxID=1396141 RepID=UPI002240F404|nr:hypothetical protein [Haloferula sp. BvORR071]